MAGVQTIIFIFFLSIFTIFFIKFLKRTKNTNSKVILGLIAFSLIVILILLLKFSIEEFVPCWYINKRYCNFTSTTYSYCKLEYLGCKKVDINSIHDYTSCGRAGFEITGPPYICHMPDGREFKQIF